MNSSIIISVFYPFRISFLLWLSYTRLCLVKLNSCTFFLISAISPFITQHTFMLSINLNKMLSSGIRWVSNLDSEIKEVLVDIEICLCKKEESLYTKNTEKNNSQFRNAQFLNRNMFCFCYSRNWNCLSLKNKLTASSFRNCLLCYVSYKYFF